MDRPKYSVTYSVFDRNPYRVVEFVRTNDGLQSRVVSSFESFESAIKHMASICVYPIVLATSVDEIDNTFKV